MNFEMPRRLNHVVFITRDTAATVRFYRDVLGMRLVTQLLLENRAGSADG
jgi:catechol 2,3-dioxygenase-like lactoylglutathione lyase family enzyme